MQAVITEKNNKVAIASPFNRDFLDEFKRNIADREWDNKGKLWLVSPACATQAIEIASRYFDVIDARGKTPDEVDDAKLEAEMAKIAADQVEILKNEEYIQRIIAGLETAIAGYSFNSKSYVKGALARDRALLEHSLVNARVPVDQLVELQIKGMSAALRLIEGGYKSPKGSHVKI